MSIVNFDDVAGTYRSIEQSGFTAEEVNSYHIPYAEAQISGRLATKYTTPFSSNNWTAKDLVTQLVYSRIAPLSEEDRRAILGDINDRIDRLLKGDELMLTDSGAIVAQPATGEIWSSTKDWPPAFSMDDPLNWEVSSLEIDNERSIRDQI